MPHSDECAGTTQTTTKRSYDNRLKIRDIAMNDDAPTARRSSSHEHELMAMTNDGKLVVTQTAASGDSDLFVSKWWLDVLFLFCGVSVFARTEAFFMQTDLFVSVARVCPVLYLCVLGVGE